MMPNRYWVLHAAEFRKRPDRLRLRVLRDVLKDSGAVPTRSSDAASIWVYCDASTEVPILAKDIARLPFPPAVHTVLLLRTSGFESEALYEDERVRVFDASPEHNIRRELRKLLAIQRPASGPVARRSVKPKALSALAHAALNLDIRKVDSTLRLIGKLKRLKKPRDFTKLLKARFDSNSDLGLHEALLLLKAGASAHDFRAYLDRPFDEKEFTVGQRWQAKRFLEFCDDLTDVLSTPEERFADNRILILDDHPGTDFQAHYKAVAEHLLGNTAAIAIVNPLYPADSQKYDDRMLRFFVNYHTLQSSQMPRSVAQLQARLFAGVRFILVDQWFKHKSGGAPGEYIGAELIRGVIRWLSDNRSEFDARNLPLPEVVALSRTDEPRIIQDAMRAGAKDYILKSRFTSLPTVLERVHRGSADALNPLHQNFRALYSLPNETIGLLQEASIPRIPFHNRNETVDLPPVDKRWPWLLTRLPKADLHVHAGSVMSREFLTMASLVMLLRHPLEEHDASNSSDWPNPKTTLAPLVDLLHRALDEQWTKVTLEPGEWAAFGGSESPNLILESVAPNAPVAGKNWYVGWGHAAKERLRSHLASTARDSHEDYKQFRAYLHRDLGIRDYLSGIEAAKKLEAKNNLEIAFYVIRHCRTATLDDRTSSSSLSLNLAKWRYEDLVRIYILVLASRYNSKRGGAKQFARVLVATDDGRSKDLLRLFRNGPADWSVPYCAAWESWRTALFGSADNPAETTIDSRSDLCVVGFEARGWSLSQKLCDVKNPPLQVDLPWVPRDSEDARQIDFAEDPIGYTLATGTRSTNLADYLLGCEFSGAEHLRHPFLMHVYSQQVLMDWVRQGVVYAELKTSPDGFAYPEIGFDYSAAVQCLIRAFSDAQTEVLKVYQATAGPQTPEVRARWAANGLGARYTLQSLRTLMVGGGDAERGTSGHRNSTRRRPGSVGPMPCKASLVFVGKRHKTLREMILEAAGAAVMRPAGDKPARSARHFVDSEFKRCRVVGFDLAGQEDGYPPIEYAEEFGRLSRLHVPITVHAGENAPPQFIEDAIIELGAARIGHGLSLAEDRRLLARLRDERIAIELCPVCNHQTSQFHRPFPSGGEVGDTQRRESGPQRRYPLADYLKNGLYVTINTDNPIISDTSMVREFFQASWAYFDGRREGLSLWDALRIIRMGFVCCFLNLEERRYMLELVGQYLFDFFSDKDTVHVLREVAAKTASPEWA